MITGTSDGGSRVCLELFSFLRQITSFSSMGQRHEKDGEGVLMDNQCAEDK